MYRLEVLENVVFSRAVSGSLATYGARLSSSAFWWEISVRTVDFCLLLWSDLSQVTWNLLMLLYTFNFVLFCAGFLQIPWFCSVFVVDVGAFVHGTCLEIHCFLVSYTSWFLLRVLLWYVVKQYFCLTYYPTMIIVFTICIPYDAENL